MVAEESTESDEALARALQQQLDRESRQRRRSQNRRRRLANQASNNAAAAAATAAPPPAARSRERSSHQRNTASSPSTPAGDINGTSHSMRSTRTGQAKTPERSQRGQSRTTGQSRTGPPDTSRDEELARSLSQRGFRASEHTQRSQMTRTTGQAPSSSRNVGASPDVSRDEELAKKLQHQEEKRSSRNLHSQHNRGRPAVEPAEGIEVHSNGDGVMAAPTSVSGLDPPTRRGRSRSRPPPARTRSRSQTRSKSRPRSRSRPRTPTRLAVAAAALSPPDSPGTANQNAQIKLNDEALARKLHQELEDEEMAQRLSAQEESRGKRRASYLARKARKRDAARGKEGKGRPSTPPTSPPSEAFDNSGDEGPVDGTRRSGREARNHRGKSMDRTRSRSRSLERSKSRSRSRSRSLRNVSASSHQYASGVVGVEQAPNEDDLLAMEVARRLEQEDADQQFAMRLSHQENRPRLPVYHMDVDANGGTSRRRWTTRRICSLAVPVVVILAAVVGLAFAFSEGDGIPSLTGSKPPEFIDDPFKGTAPEDANRWNTQQSGLSLVIQNALDENWETLFTVSVDEWDVGNPDALTLVTERVPIDPNCEKVSGKLKVCNGDYGETRWRGINQVLLNNGFIVSSVAKLNEFYLREADNAQRQYTMCHEIGHGFGLPHTDENFFNADTFNCMDYTSNPEANKSPSEDNFVFLFDLYGLSRRKLERWKRTKTNVNVPKTPMNPAIAKLLKEVEWSIEHDEMDPKDSDFMVEEEKPHTRRLSYKLDDIWELKVTLLLAEPLP